MSDSTVDTVTISVVIPTHRRPVLLRRALQSLVVQSVKPSEVIVVDDVGLEETENVVGEFQDDLNVMLLFNEAGGVSSSRNLGVSKTSAEYVCFLDDDDWFHGNKIERITAAILEDNDHQIGLFYHPALIFLVNERYSYYTNPADIKHESELLSRLWDSNAIGGTPMTCIKVDDFRAVAGFDEALDALEDYELWIRLVLNGTRAKKIDEALTCCEYLSGVNSVSKAIEANVRAFDTISEKYTGKLGENSVKHLKRNRWLRKMIVQKCLLMKDRRAAVSNLLAHREEGAIVEYCVLFLSIILGLKYSILLKRAVGHE